MKILGLHDGPDAAAVVTVDGRIAAYRLRERHTRRKHAAGLEPADIAAVLETAGLTAADLDLIAATTPEVAGLRAAQVVPPKLAHAAAAAFVSPFERAAVLVHDEAGAAAFLLGPEGLEPLGAMALDAAAVYRRIGAALGLGGGAPGKLMGLAPYGRPRFPQRRPHETAEAWLARCVGDTPLGDPASVLSEVPRDLAASAQAQFEAAVLGAVRALAGRLKAEGRPVPALCLGGAAALNCPANARLFRDGPFPHLFVPPWCDDSGLAIGAALWAEHAVGGRRHAPQPPPSPYLGPPIDPKAVRAALAGLPATRPDDAAASAAADLAQGRVIGWIESGSEAGPRALGHRSLLADPRRAEAWPRLNALKQREGWRPFAPAVLADAAAEWFDGLPLPSPFMLFTGQVRTPAAVPAITHVDGSARVQTVGPECGGLHAVLSAFAARTGVPVLLNTSFNGPDEPIAESPQDAVALFRRTPLDVLYIDGYRIDK